MNEFTKEELEHLLLWRKSILYTKKPSKEIIKENDILGNKIQSMIDNYCDHDGEIGKDYPAEKCMKCNRMWE